MKPPFPANAGVFGCPTTVNNLETIAAVPTAFALGAEEFSKLGALHSIGDGGVRVSREGTINTGAPFGFAQGKQGNTG